MAVTAVTEAAPAVAEVGAVGHPTGARVGWSVAVPRVAAVGAVVTSAVREVPMGAQSGRSPATSGIGLNLLKGSAER